jgi:ABC-type branched-subunit amino acid transport system ATPase component/ABC-type branched-subunit amino acid transport system permease subunit
MARIDRGRAARLVALALIVAWPWLPLPSSFVGNANTAGLFFLPALSVVVLTGWVGQISLAQASFVGIGAYLAAMATRDFGIGFPFNVPVGALAAALAAAVLGIVALRVRGLFLAVATLIFAWATDSYLFTARWMGGVGRSTSADVSAVGRPGQLPYFDFTDRKTFYYVVVATCALAVFAVLNLRDSRIGRAFFAVRGSEIAAASFGIDVVRTKLVAFALSGFIAGLAGSLIIVSQGSVAADQFDLTRSLFYLSVAVVGGLSSVSGAVPAALIFAGLDEVFFRVDALAGYLDVVSALLLAVVLLGYPGGLAALGRRMTSVVRTFTARRRGGETAGKPAAVVELETRLAPSSNGHRSRRGRRPKRRVDAPPVLRAGNVTVRFGGLTAVDDVSLEVRKGEIVGLIGPNGAGKTTMFNAVSGLNQPATGTVHLHGADMTGKAVHERAAAGLARTFQVLQLFPQLDVLDNVLVGTYLHSRAGVLSNIVLTQRAITADLDALTRAREVIAMLDLGEVARHPVAGLPFGTLRMVELARALATGAPLVMLDEPASGLDNAETDRLSRILHTVRDELGVSLLVIEHDVRMVTALTEYMYVLDQGRLIAEGTPAEIQRDEAVIAAYLGSSRPRERIEA